MNYSQTQGPRLAQRVVTLHPSAFADDWEKKPDEPMKCGLRLVSEGDIEKARSAAVERSIEMVPEPGQDRVDNFNDALMRGIVARATCMPENAREGFFETPEDDVRDALTPEAVRFLWDEYGIMKLETCGFLAEADDDELAELAAMLLNVDAWQNLPVGKSRRLRKLALHLLEELDPDIRD